MVFSALQSAFCASFLRHSTMHSLACLQVYYLLYKTRTNVSLHFITNHFCLCHQKQMPCLMSHSTLYNGLLRKKEGGKFEYVDKERERSTFGRQNSMIGDCEESSWAGNELQEESFTRVAKQQICTFASRPRIAREILLMRKQLEANSKAAQELGPSDLFCCKTFKCISVCRQAHLQFRSNQILAMLKGNCCRALFEMTGYAIAFFVTDEKYVLTFFRQLSGSALIC